MLWLDIIENTVSQWLLSPILRFSLLQKSAFSNSQAHAVGGAGRTSIKLAKL